MKIKTIILSLILLLTSSILSHALSDGDWEYQLILDGGRVVVGYNGSETTVKVPSTVGGSTVKAIGSDVFAGMTDLQTVTVPSTVTYIGDRAFKGCSSLTSVSIPTSLFLINAKTSVYLSNKVDGIGEEAFKGCISLKSVTIPTALRTLEANVFENCSSLTKVVVSEDSKLTTIQGSAFMNCSKLNMMSRPNTLSLPGYYYISLPGKVTTIGYGAFGNCSAIKTVYFPEGVDSIDKYAFRESGITSARFYGNAPSMLGVGAFWDVGAGFEIRYYADKTGWSTPTWNGYPTVKIETSSGEDSDSNPDSGSDNDSGNDDGDNSNSGGNSDDGNVDVPDAVAAPTISSNPQSQTVDIYSFVTFTVAARGTGPFSYQWQHNGIEIPGATQSSFTIASADEVNAGGYRCLVSNEGGIVASDVGTLRVNSYTKVPLYRFNRVGNPSHFFTANEAEKDILLTELAEFFDMEGTSQHVVELPFLNAKPVFRMYNSQSGAHFYTAFESERDMILANLPFFSYEGIAFFVFHGPEPGTLPVFRFFVPQTGSHFFTISEDEKDHIVETMSDVMRLEGVAWYAYPQ